MEKKQVQNKQKTVANEAKDKKIQKTPLTPVNQLLMILGLILIITGLYFLFFTPSNNIKKTIANQSPNTPLKTIITENTTTPPIQPNTSINNSINTSTSNSTKPSNLSTTNATVNYTQLCLNNSVYVGNFNLATRNLNYSWAPYYGVYYARVFVDYSSSLNKTFADISDVFAFNGTHCSYTPVFEGQTVVLPECSFIMKVNGISLVGGAWVANVDISHC